MHPVAQAFLEAYWSYAAAAFAVVGGLCGWIGGIVAGRIARNENARIERDFWHFQRSWSEREKFFAAILTALYRLERATSSISEQFEEPGSGQDNSIHESEAFQRLTTEGQAALADIHALMGAASIHLPDEDYVKLEQLFGDLWNADCDSVCTADYFKRSLKLVSELRKSIRGGAKRALNIKE